jgi:hypothetical protein
MALQIIDYSKIPAKSPDLSGLTDIFENALKGYKIAKEPEKMGQEEEQRRLINAFKQLKLQQEPERFRAEMQGSSLSNKLKNLQIIAANMEVDPNAKLAYINALTNALGGSAAANTGNNSFNLKDALIKKALGIPLNSETPEQKKQRAIDVAIAKDEQKLRSKDIHNLEQNIPEANNYLSKIDKAIDIINQDKANKWFGPGVLGFKGLGGSVARKRGIKDQDYGTLESIFGDLVGEKAKSLSAGNKVLATALNLAGEIKPNFDENLPIVKGKLNQIRDELVKSLERQTGFYKNQGGRNESILNSRQETSSNSLVQIRSPDGKIKLIPQSAVAAALKAGGKRA